MDRARRVDKRETAMHQRLHHFSWDLACGYPAAGHRTEPLDPAAMVASLGVEIAAADEGEEGEEDLEDRRRRRVWLEACGARRPAHHGAVPVE